MTVSDLIRELDLAVFALDDGDREIEDAYCGDLLSWVMGKAPADSAWVTIMSNQNVAAVAVLTDVACAILCEGVQPDADLVERCEKQGINLLGSPLSEYRLCARLAEALS